MTKAVITEITGADGTFDEVVYPYAGKNRVTLLGMNQRAGLDKPENMIMPGRDITIKIHPDFGGRSDVAAVRFYWNCSGGNTTMLVMVYATPNSPYAVLADKEKYSNTVVKYGDAELTPVIRLTMAHDPGPSRMEIFQGEYFQKVRPLHTETMLLINPVLDIAKKLISGIGVDLAQELKGTIYESALPATAQASFRKEAKKPVPGG